MWQGISWVARMLPFIEQGALYDRLDFNIAGITTSLDPNAAPALSVRFPQLHCPHTADEVDRRVAGDTSTTSQRSNTMHYYGIMGVVVPPSRAAAKPTRPAATTDKDH
ncbi:MAG: DUF1559 domain-containing protein [Planctomycetia bacterium]|nr:DUF1559 domain-containing protein [Planctomycetia bacterium]